MSTGFVCGDRLDAALRAPRFPCLHRHHGDGSRRPQCIGVRGHDFSAAASTFSKRTTARHVGPNAVLAAQDGSSLQEVAEDNVEQAWDTAGGPNTPVVPTNQLVSLQIPSK